MRGLSLLHDGGERLLGEPPRLEVRALAQLRDAQLDRAGANLSAAVALGQTVRALLAVAGSGQAGHLRQALGRNADRSALEDCR